VDRRVFINYRGEDSYSYGALLYTELARQFGEEQVFLDCESIPAGADFVEELLNRVRSARVLLAVIGPRWLTATNPTGQRRIDDPADWIRRELAGAFAAGVRVIPVLTEQAEIPVEAELPADIAALSRCQYRQLRRHDPVADLARIAVDLTSLDPALAAAARGRDGAPRQLPAAPALFTGRATEMVTLTDAAATTPDAGTTVVISAIGGAGGIGKTALALHWAYQHLHRFPDGQLYVNLRGFDPSGHAMPVGEAVRGFLDGLGVDPSTLPVELDAQAARYRSLVAGKRMLIVLDNARDDDQVTPLLPGSPTCTVLVTSRHDLAGLAVLHGARLLDLDILPEPDTRTLLARHLGDERLAVEPDAVAELLAVCAGLPLAVAIVAARAQQHPTFPLTALAEELRDASARLDGLAAGDLRANLRAVLSWSVRTLSPQAAELFALLGIAPGPDISLPASASLAALSTGQARTLLRELENASLIQESVPGRYRMHDLIRLYATDIAHRDVVENVRQSALRRVLDFYTRTIHGAACLLDPRSALILPPLPTGGIHPQLLPDAPAAMIWLDAEHAILLAAQHTAAQYAWHQAIWQLAYCLRTYHARRGYLHDDLTIWLAALAAAEHLPDPASHIAHRFLAIAYADLGDHEAAIGHLHQALTEAEHHHDQTAQAQTHFALSWVWQRLDDGRRAIEEANQALILYRALNDPEAEARVLGQMGWYAAQLGEYDQARENCQAALTLSRSHDDPVGEANILNSLGYIDHHTGHHRQAVHRYQQALILFRDLDSNYDIPNTLKGLGYPFAALGQRDQARAAWREALELYQQQGRDNGVALVQGLLDDLDNIDGAAHSTECGNPTG
jgi:tetratricopeptide (TPR) repeat protein